MNPPAHHSDLFREVFDHAFDSILMVDPAKDRIVDVNRSARQMLACSQEILRSRPFSEVVVDAGDVFSTVGQGWIGPLVFRACDGRTVLTESSVSRIEVSGGVYLIVTARESAGRPPAAERRARQREIDLRRSSRLAAMGEIVASLANDLNQPLAAIALNVRALERTAGGKALPEALREALADIADDSHRAGDTLWNLLHHLRGEAGEPRDLEVNHLVGEIAALLHEEVARQKGTLILDLGDKLPSVRGDRLHLQQAVLNLVRNAAEALGDVPSGRGTVTLTTRSEQGAVGVAVADQGLGLSPEARRRMFEPLFTTRPGQLGMGLAITRSIVESHGGRLWAESPSQGGTVVQMTLPTPGSAAS